MAKHIAATTADMTTMTKPGSMPTDIQSVGRRPSASHLEAQKAICTICTICGLIGAICKPPFPICRPPPSMIVGASLQKCLGKADIRDGWDSPEGRSSKLSLMVTLGVTPRNWPAEGLEEKRLQQIATLQGLHRHTRSKMHVRSL